MLVTGGAGFLGQHVVGLLQARADHVTEVRVLDVVPYVNKLGEYIRAELFIVPLLFPLYHNVFILL